MGEWIKRLIGIKKLEEEKKRIEEENAQALARLAETKAKEEEAKKAEELARMTPKERATALDQPWVAVLDTKVNQDNPRNGFFELDWNERFIVQLKQAGYGFEADPEEEIVDRWFRDLCKDVANEEGIDMTDRGSGFINVKKLTEGKSEVS